MTIGGAILDPLAIFSVTLMTPAWQTLLFFTNFVVFSTHTPYKSTQPAGLCGSKTTNHRPIIACVEYISPAHPQASPVREQRAVHKSRLDLCPIKALVAMVPELVVMVLDVEPVRAKGSASKSISKKTKQQVRAQTLAKWAVPQLAVLPRLIILDTPAMAAASAQQWTPCPRDYQQRKSDQCCSYGLKLLRLLLMVLHPVVSHIQTPRPVHEEVRVFDIWKEELAPTLAV